MSTTKENALLRIEHQCTFYIDHQGMPKGFKAPNNTFVFKNMGSLLTSLNLHGYLRRKDVR